MKMKKVVNNKESKNGVLLEELNHKFDLVLEYASDIPSIKEKVTGLENKVDGLTEDMAIVKTNLESVKILLKRK